MHDYLGRMGRIGKVFGIKALKKFEQYYLPADFIAGNAVAGQFNAAVNALAGVYGSGLITVLDVKLGNSLSNEWQWLLVDGISLAATWSGNVFFWSPKHDACFYLDTQRGKTTFVDRSIDAVFNDFLIKDGVKKDVLFSGHFAEINARLGDLSYCECYIAKPWSMLGGSGASDTFGKGDMGVYLSLTGQAIRKAMSKT